MCAGVKFNVVVFGSSWQFMSSECQDYTEESAATAVAWVQANVHANWGGTNIGGTLDAIYSTPICEGALCDPFGACKSCHLAMLMWQVWLVQREL